MLARLPTGIGYALTAPHGVPFEELCLHGATTLAAAVEATCMLRAELHNFTSDPVGILGP